MKLLFCGLVAILNIYFSISSKADWKRPYCPPYWVRVNRSCFRLSNVQVTYNKSRCACENIKGVFASAREVPLTREFCEQLKHKELSGGFRRYYGFFTRVFYAFAPNPMLAPVFNTTRCMWLHGNDCTWQMEPCSKDEPKHVLCRLDGPRGMPYSFAVGSNGTEMGEATVP